MRFEGEVRRLYPLIFKLNLSQDLLARELWRVLQVLGYEKLQIRFRLK